MADSELGKRVYIGGLYKIVHEASLRTAFAKYKPVRVDVKHGFAFINFETKQDAQTAASEMDGKELDGSRMSVEIAKGEKIAVKRRHDTAMEGWQLFCRKLNERTTWQELKDFARPVAAGPISFTDVKIVHDDKCGMIEYTSESDARRAYRKLNGTMLHGQRVWLTLKYRKAGERDARTVERDRRRRSRSHSSDRSRSRSRDKSRRRRRSRSRSPRRSSRSRSPHPRAPNPLPTPPLLSPYVRQQTVPAAAPTHLRAPVPASVPAPVPVPAPTPVPPAAAEAAKALPPLPSAPMALPMGTQLVMHPLYGPVFMIPQQPSPPPVTLFNPSFPSPAVPKT